MDSAELREFLTMEDHPGDVALLDAIERAADEIDRLRAQVETLSVSYNGVALHTTRLRRVLRKFVTEGLTRAEANAVLAETAPPAKEE